MKNGTNGAAHVEQPQIAAAKFADMFEGAVAYGQWIILKKQELNSEKTAGGIVLPNEQRRERPGWEVISIGEAVKIPVKVGDFVMFDGNRIVVDEASKSAYAIAAETQVMCKLDPEQTKERMVSVLPHIGMM